MARQVRSSGDVNAKSYNWGCDKEDARGTALTEWIARNDFTIVNQESKPTFQRGSQQSIIDITAVTNQNSSSITEWKAMSDCENGSDQNYIIYTYAPERNTRLGPTIDNYTRWFIKKNSDNETIDDFKKQNTKHEEEKYTVKVYDDAIINTMNKVHRKQMRGNRRPVYWWNSNIAEQRKIVIAER